MAAKIKRSKQTLVTVLLLVAVVFVVGLILGSSYRNQSSSEVTKILRSSELDAESFLVEQELFLSFERNCDFATKRLNDLSVELYRLGKVLGGQDAEEKLGSDDYRFLKRKYHLMQIRTFVLEKRVHEECGSPSNVVLYYFQRGDSKSKVQGEILDGLVRDLDLHVYALELGYAKELEFLEEYFGVVSAPAVVINFKDLQMGVVNREWFEEKFNGRAS